MIDDEGESALSAFGTSAHSIRRYNSKHSINRVTRRGLEQLHVESENWTDFTTAVTKILEST